ncbi:MAG: hypothetical protein IKR06_03260 [Erysipelotrichaceae bacterium]|nr:hypothetical protein [Erysipelotrichaceae bacterium]
MKAHELDLDSIVFAELRRKLNEAIERTVWRMKKNGMPEGQINAKIKIGMLSHTDENGEIHTTAVFEPKVTYKIGASEEEKCGATGGKITIGDDGSVLVGSEQVTMDELMDDQKGA